MKVDKSEIEGLYTLKIDVKKDIRGVFLKPYSLNELKEHHLIETVSEVFYSTSDLNVIRGMHFQVPPYAQQKLVGVINGTIIEVVLDIRRGSKTFGKYCSFKLEANEGKFLFIPEGLAHGFLSLFKSTTVLYIVDKRFSSEHEGGIKYDSFGFSWPVESPIISERDRNFVAMDKFITPFELI